MNLVKEKWDDIIQKLKIEYDINDAAFKVWILPLKVREERDFIVYIVAPSEYHMAVLMKKYLLHLQVCIEEITGIEYEIRFITEENSGSFSSETNLNPQYTFDIFAVSSNNNFAHAASVAVMEAPGELYNPFYIYGEISTGKTHMLHAIGNYIVRNHHDKKVYYTTGEMIVDEIDEALNKQGTTIKKLRNKYHAIDVLLIDDIQFMIGKECVQMGFLEIVEYMIAHGKQIVVSCDRPLNGRNTFSEKLKSCFASGLVAWLIQDTDVVGQVLEAVARYYRITSEDLIGDVRRSEILTPRFVAMYLMCEVKKISLSEICRKMNRNFENISYGIETIKREIVKDSELKEIIDELGQMIR